MSDWNAAIEAAARVCDARAVEWSRLGDVARECEADECAAAIRALRRPEAAPAWKHVKRGTTYVEVGRATLQAATGPAGEGDTLVIYRGEDGRLWAREAHEFEDGRFQPVGPSPARCDCGCGVHQIECDREGETR